MTNTNALVAGSLFIEEDVTWVGGALSHRTWYAGGAPAATPPDAFDDPIAFVDRISETARRRGLTEMTVIIDASAAKLLGLPARAPNTEEKQENHPLIGEWNGAGWRIKAITPWLNLWRPDNRPAVHIGVHPWLRHGGQKETCPFPIDDPQRLVELLAKFHHVTGVAYHGVHAGNPGMSLLRQTWHRARGSAAPRWVPRWEGCSAAMGNTERPFRDHVWNERPARFSTGYDAVRQYLPAASNTLVSPDALRRTGAIPWERRRSGYWRITSPAWNIDGLPHPANYAPGADCWVSGPTMELLMELAEKGFIEHPEIHDSWTADGAGEYLRPWAKAIEDAYNALRHDESTDANYLRATVKDMYKKGIGTMHRQNGRVRRPDWHHAIIAKARANVFRKMFAVWELTKVTPDQIHYDEIWYSFDNPDEVPMRWQGNRRAPAFPTEGDSWGNFKATTKERKR